MSIKKLLTVAILGLVTVFAGVDAKASDYPNKTIKLLVMANPGGGTDIFARKLIPLLQKELGQTLVVVNQPGGGGNLAANSMLQARPDGYTIALLGTGVLGLNYATLNVSYKYEDMVAVTPLAAAPWGLYAAADSKWNNFDDVVKTAKEENRPIKIAVFETLTRYILPDLAKDAGIEFTIVPSQSAPTTLTAVMGKHVELGSIGSGMSDSVVAGKAKLIASLSPMRFTQVPNTKTIKEQGYNARDHFDYTLLYAPAKMPKEDLAILEKAIVKVQQTKEYADIVKELGFVASPEIGREAASKITKSNYDFAMEIKAAK